MFGGYLPFSRLLVSVRKERRQQGDMRTGAILVNSINTFVMSFASGKSYPLCPPVRVCCTRFLLVPRRNENEVNILSSQKRPHVHRRSGGKVDGRDVCIKRRKRCIVPATQPLTSIVPLIMYKLIPNRIYKIIH
jgi:hypothetical protein